MAILFIDGFDNYSTEDNPQYGVRSMWTNLGPTGNIDTVSGRFGGRCLEIYTTSSNNPSISRTFLPTSDITVGFAFKLSESLPGNSNGWGLLNFYSDTNQKLGALTIIPSGAIGYHRSRGTAVGMSAAGVIAPDTWYYVEIELHLADGILGTVKISIDGTEVCSAIGVDTNNYTGALCASVNFDTWDGGYGSAIDRLYVDDMYAKNDLIRLGPCKIDTLEVTGDAGPNEGTPSTAGDHYAMIDDAQFDGTNDILISSGGEEWFNSGLMTEQPQGMYAVQYSMWARGGARYNLKMRRGASVADFGKKITAKDVYSKREFLFETDPTTASLPWGTSSFGSLDLGVEVE